MSRIDYDCATRTHSISLNENDCKTLRPILIRAIKAAWKRYEKYSDIFEGGEATERQTDAMQKANEECRCLEYLLKNINILISDKQK